MRTAFITALIEQARLHPELFLVVGDLGYSVIEPFAQEFPDRFLNAGVAEQNMTGIAAGLASEGYHVFTYSIANFPTLRCLEQIRNDICYHGLPVTVAAVGGGMAYGNLGYSHHAVQDIAIMRTLPGIRVYAPGDPGETRECIAWQVAHPGPAYLRLGKAGEPLLHETRGINSGPLRVREGGGRIALVTTGGILKVAADASEILAKEGIVVDVFSVPLLKPVSPNYFGVLASFQALITLEEHVAEGGLASVLRENLRAGPELISLHVDEFVAHCVGSQDYLRDKAGIGAARVTEVVRGIAGKIFVS